MAKKNQPKRKPPFKAMTKAQTEKANKAAETQKADGKRHDKMVSEAKTVGTESEKVAKKKKKAAKNEKKK